MSAGWHGASFILTLKANHQHDVQGHDPEGAYLVVSPRAAGVVHGKIEVIPADPVDRAEERLADERDLDPGPSATQVPKDERESEPVGQGTGGGCRLPRLERMPQLAARERDARDRRERDHALPAPLCLSYEVGCQPVPADASDNDLDGAAGIPALEDQVQRIAGTLIRDGDHCHDAVPDAQTADPEAFPLCLEVVLLGREPKLELALEVREEIVPAHSQDANEVRSGPAKLSTGHRK